MSRLYEAVMGLVVADAQLPSDGNDRLRDPPAAARHLIGRQFHDACDLGEF